MLLFFFRLGENWLVGRSLHGYPERKTMVQIKQAKRKKNWLTSLLNAAVFMSLWTFVKFCLYVAVYVELMPRDHHKKNELCLLETISKNNIHEHSFIYLNCKIENYNKVSCAWQSHGRRNESQIFFTWLKILRTQNSKVQNGGLYSEGIFWTKFLNPYYHRNYQQNNKQTYSHIQIHSLAFLI